MITRSNLVANAEMLTEAWGYGSGDVLLHSLPLFHVHGLFVALNLALLNGGPVIMLPKFDPEEKVLEAMPDATVMMGVPTYYTRLPLLIHVLIVMSVVICASSFQDRLLYWLKPPDEFFPAGQGDRILERYGMTETGMLLKSP